MNKICALFSALILLTAQAAANMGPVGFYNFPNYYFVETGTFGGDGIALALKTNGYQEIYSLEINSTFVTNAKERFRNNPNVHIVQGDSSRDLGRVISQLNKPITFWLDGHYGEAAPFGGKNTPLFEELNQIKHHPIKTHTIMIDDMHCCGTILFDYITQQQIIEKILEINPNYVIDYIDGGNDGEYPNNIMIARVPGK